MWYCDRPGVIYREGWTILSKGADTNIVLKASFVLRWSLGNKVEYSRLDKEWALECQKALVYLVLD